MSDDNGFFNAPKTPTQAAAESKQSGNSNWLSPFHDLSGKPYNMLTIRPNTEVTVRLFPVFSSRDQDGNAINVKSVEVKSQVGGQMTTGKILSGQWFDTLEKWMYQKYKSRFHSMKKNPAGDLKIRHKIRVLGWCATMISPADGEDAVPMLRVFNFAGKNYPRAAIGDGDLFRPAIITTDTFGNKSSEGGDFDLDFNPVEGREITIKASLKNPADASSKVYRFTPARTATPIAPKWMPAIPAEWLKMSKEQRPALLDILRQSPPQEIRAALQATLPADIFEAWDKELGDATLVY